ncbi:hypothetical protein PAPYR_12547 [Paratrimastix pyriformis]|uniref:Uncharacterized protein n=1 Tax=Paratrimastix pyriformis TaxID=342808 RepID=A0ABQ8U462_9EUKA|nr:hypothetical protein PAPYR_12547 [Paratrimastix pyriformis]
MPDHCCSAAFCLTEITVPSQPPDIFQHDSSGSPYPSLILHKFSLFRQPPPARSYPHAQYSFSSPQPFSQHPLCTSHLLQTLDSIDSRVNSYPFLPYFIHQLTSIDPATPIVPSAPCYPSLSPIHTPLPETHQKCLQRDGPSPYASQKRA